MRNGTLYAKRVKRVFQNLRRQYGSAKVPEPSDPVEQLVIALLAYEVPVSRAVRAATALLEAMVDYNEVRVSTTAEIANVIRSFVPDGFKCADAIRRALGAVFKKEHAISLKSLHKIGRREAKRYLEELDGVDSSAAASVLLWSLGAHAIPVGVCLYQTMQEEKLVHPSASIEEVQAFLERNITADDAREFCLLMQRWVASKAPRKHVTSPADGHSKSKQRGGSERPLAKTDKRTTNR